MSLSNRVNEGRYLDDEMGDDCAWDDAIVSALERTQRNLLLAINGKPVRDLEENLAENRRALGLA